MKNKDSIICLIITVLALVISYALKRNMIFIYLFAMVYVILIYVKFHDNSRKLMYFISLLFAIVSLGDRKNYYISFALYGILLLKTKWYCIKSTISNFSVKKLNKYSIFLIIFISYMIISIFWSMNKSTAIDYLMRYVVSITMILMVVWENRSNEELKETFDMASCLVLGVLVIGLVEITGYDFGLPNHFQDQNIVYTLANMIPVTFFYNPNNYAVFLVIALIMSFRQIFYKKQGMVKVINLLNVFLIIINIIFTRSRVALISCILSLVFVAIFALMNIKRNKKFAIRGVVFSSKYVAMICLIFMIVSIFPGMSYYTGKFAKIPIVAEISKMLNKPSSIGGEEEKPDENVVIGEEGSDNIRLTLMHDVVVEGLIKEKNYFGVGVGNSVNFIESMGNTHGVLNVHSLWFEILCDFGVFIFLYTIYIYIMLFVDFFKLRKKVNLQQADFYLSGMTLTVANVLLVFGPSFVISFTPFIISLGIMYAVCSLYKRECKVNE